MTMTCIYIFFHSRDPAMSPQGGLTMGQTAEGRSPPVEQSVGSWDRGRGADPHTWTSALQHGVPPYREQKELLADDSVSSADMLPRPSPRGAVSMTEESVALAPLCYKRRREWQWNSRAGNVVKSMGVCNSADSQNDRGPPQDPR